MTAPTTYTFGQFLIKLGDRGSPETFASPCGLTSKNFNQTANAQEDSVPPCDDPDAPADIQRVVTTLSREISGSGKLTGEAFTTWQAWFDSAASKNCRIYPKGSSGGYYEGLFVLTAFNMAAPQPGQMTTGDLTMQSNGPCPWNPGS